MIYIRSLVLSLYIIPYFNGDIGKLKLHYMVVLE
nr:MAG TPA: hypothetical protein [Caudoviricetes sp.]